MEKTIVQERVIVSLTSYKPRLSNLPVVLDTIFSQTMPPDLLVLNLAYDEELPSNVLQYISDHHVEVFRVPDTKVYKKLIPTLKRYPNDVVITIDDDFLYPNGMIEEFVRLHVDNPNNPIGGAHWSYHGKMARHCGCASLTKADFIGDYMDVIDEDLIQNCPSSDIVYAYLSVLNGHPYICSQSEFFLNMTSYKDEQGYSDGIGTDGQQITFNYLKKRFGELPEFFSAYLGDTALAYTFHVMMENEMENRLLVEKEKIYASRAYRLGRFLLKPLKLFRRR